MAQPLNIDTFVWATGAFCQLNRVPYDASLLIKQFPPPYDVVNLQQALQSFGLNNSIKRFSIEQLPNASLSCLAFLNSIPIHESNTEDQPAYTYGVVLVLRRSFDNNHDNVIDKDDDVFSSLRVWQDKNGNGISEDGELKTLTEAGITSINLNSLTYALGSAETLKLNLTTANLDGSFGNGVRYSANDNEWRIAA